MNPPSPADAVGPYRLLHELGRGGQAVVWLAEDTRVGRRVALKILPTLGPGSEVALQRFRREAAVTSRLDHPGICPVYEADIHGGVPFLAMRFVDGETLARRVQRGRDGDRDVAPLGDVRRIASFFAAAARALHAAHEAGVLHRDIKPANVMVTPAGEPVLLDFGLARADDDAQVLSRSGDASGTPTYMSPEQMSGGRIDRRSDVYSLGATLFEAITGRAPFTSPTLAGLLNEVLHQEVGDVRRWRAEVPADLAVVVATATAKECERRYRTALDFAVDLEHFVAFEPIAARPSTWAQRLLRWVRRKPALAASLGAAAVLLLVACGALAYGVGANGRAAAETQLRERVQQEQRQQAQAAADRELAQRLDDLGVRLGTLLFGVQGGAEALPALPPAYDALLRPLGFDADAADAVERGRQLLAQLHERSPDTARALREGLRGMAELAAEGSPRQRTLRTLTGVADDRVLTAFASACAQWRADGTDGFAALLTPEALQPLSAEQLADAATMLLRVEDRAQDAVRLFARALRQRPDSFALHYRLAGITLSRMRGASRDEMLAALQDAIVHVRIAVSLRPASGIARSLLAAALAYQTYLSGNETGFEESLYWLDSAVQQEPDNALVWFLRADYLRRAPGRSAEVKTACEHALQLDPGLVPARKLLESLAK